MDSRCTKRSLCHGSIDNYSSIYMRTWTSRSGISCIVHNYPDLCNSVYHCLTRTASESEMEFKVFKKPKTHFFQLHCQLMDDMSFHVKYDEDEFSEIIITNITEYGYWVEVSKKIIYDPRNKYLHQEKTLVVQFRSGCCAYYTNPPFINFGRLTRRDEELFSRDMLKLYEIRESTGDFLLKVKGEQFKVHKFVLDARSSWFKLNPNTLSCKEINVIGEPLVMDKVVRYMYSGVLEGTELGDMFHVFEIAVTLEMAGLIQTASALVMKVISKDNVRKVLTVAKKLGLKDVKAYAEEYIEYLSEMGCGFEVKKKNRRKKRH